MTKFTGTTKYSKYGFIPPVITETDYILGSKKLPEKIIRSDGQWDNFLPVNEIQRKLIETMNCSCYGTLNALETFHKALYSIEHNWAERYIGIIANTTTQGNSPHKVAEVIRKTAGLIPETELPFNNSIKSWAEYYSPKPMTQKYLDIGKEWLEKYEFLHEYVFVDTTANYTYKQKLLMKALQYSPLGVSVMAWQHRNGRYYKNPSQRDNHWCCLYGYVKGNYWKVFDSYDNTHKRLEWDYNFNFVKRYHLKKKKKGIIMITKKKLTEIYHELLCREPDNFAKGYLAYDEDFVRKELGKSKERQQLIKVVNFARKLRFISGS